MCPSGNVKVFSAGDPCLAAEAGTADAGTSDAGTALAVVAVGPAVEAGGNVNVAVRFAMVLTTRLEAAAGAPGCGPQPARARPMEEPAMVTAVKSLARCECIV